MRPMRRVRIHESKLSFGARRAFEHLTSGGRWRPSRLYLTWCEEADINPSSWTWEFYQWKL